MDNILRTLEKNAREREELETQRRREELAKKLEPFVLGYVTRKKYQGQLRTIRNNCFKDFTDLDKSNKTLLTVREFLQKAPRCVASSKTANEITLFCNVCRHIIISLDSNSKEVNFAAAFLNKETLAVATKLISTIFAQIPDILLRITGEKAVELKQWQCLIHLVIGMSTPTTWAIVRNAPQVQTALNGLCAKLMAVFYEEDNYEKMTNSLFIAVNDQKPIVSLETVNAQYSIIYRVVRNRGENENLFSIFVTRILTCPAIIQYLNPQNLESIRSTELFERALFWLRANQEELESNLDVRVIINLLANLIHMAYNDEQTLIANLYEWTWCIGVALTRCTEMAVNNTNKSNLHYWHPVFGHYLVPIDKKTEGALRNVVQQLRLLWSAKIVRCLFDKAFASAQAQLTANNDTNMITTSNAARSPSNHKDLGAAFSKLWRKLGGTSNDSTSSTKEKCVEIPESPPTLTAVVCQLYMTALSTMIRMKREIVSGLCRDDQLLRQLWLYIKEWGAKNSSGSSSIFNTSSIDHYGPVSASLQSLKRLYSPHTATLRLFADATAAIVSILDEEEIFEKSVPFSVKELEAVSRYNNIFYEVTASTNTLFQSMHSLCMVLYERDSRRSFVSDPKFWLVSEVKSSAIMTEYEKKTSRGILLMRKMSHLVPIKERMLLFRRQVNEDKTRVSNIAADTHLQTWITVQRNRLIEDGFHHLSKLSVTALKSTIRVKFINEQGLDESGIDQDGVFKEFLELTLKKVFDPQMNLFSTTATGVIYPSPTSSLHEDHLSLFTFVGRMLGKAVYEGIVVDVQLAPVLLAAILGSHRLCAFDELSQLDAELYRNLTFVKRYEGDMTDLSLTFSIDEDFLGKIHTVDLVPSGRTIPVTNENKIDYVHRMAHHRVFKRTQEQCRAFVQGIQSFLQPTWLSIFAPHDLQCLISGQNSDIDLDDLKRHVQYFGGFHGSHRLIKWLWDILENKFTAEERKLFLKFVTSCSRPPVLGFSYLEPPFSIRCVEVSDDQDQGDTLGSVVRGFLTLRNGTTATRLPTASTCFNLLKLPNYNKKSLLLEKLRYAIHAGTGFELS
ncbi:unnamed protein product [Caenorhabditis bovis]|uniref:Ubiquitin-protein ligase E3B n=1 Tax=Caenorhabditis bovis TaxID=2654633 RepID=A0A8S1EMR1_9PELO|nr:unnamed protein product [Caenorhabditis bovis]